MPLKDQTPVENSFTSTKPLTDTTKRANITTGERALYWTMGLIILAWLALFALMYSLRNYNI